MNSISLQLLVQVSLATAIPVVDNGMGENILGLEATVTDFAVLTRNNQGNNLDNKLGNLPPEFTICSSIASNAFLGSLSFFQLLYENGEPWVTVKTRFGIEKDATQHRFQTFVSSSFMSISSKLNSFTSPSSLVFKAINGKYLILKKIQNDGTLAGCPVQFL